MLKFCVKILFCQHYFNTFMEKGKDLNPVRYAQKHADPDPQHGKILAFFSFRNSVYFVRTFPKRRLRDWEETAVHCSYGDQRSVIVKIFYKPTPPSVYLSSPSLPWSQKTMEKIAFPTAFCLFSGTIFSHFSFSGDTLQVLLSRES